MHRSSIGRVFFGVAIVALALISFSGCATTSKFDPLLPQVSITKATQADIRAFGVSYIDNPYMEPRSLIRGKLNEFFVVKLDFNLPAEARVSIMAEAKTSGGIEAARARDSYSFVEFWDSMTVMETEKGAEFQRKVTAIERSCVSSFDFMLRAGKDTLFLPFTGPNPIQRPATIYVQVVVGKGEPVTFTEKLL
jgi:hypothetical protein